MAAERVLITGIGAVSPIGVGREAFWTGCLEARSGAVRLDSPWVVETRLATRIACPVRGFDPVAAGIPVRLARFLDVTTCFAMAAADEAVRDAGFAVVEDPERRDQLRLEGLDPARLGVVVGSGIGGLRTIEISHAAWRETRNKEKVKRYSLPMLIPNAPAGQTAIRFQARAECKALSTACAAGTMALGDAVRILQDGQADVVLAGGAEGIVSDDDAYGLMGFERLRTMSTRNDEPTRASRPFERHRDGFVLAEGAAMLVLERESHARARGVTPYASVAGYASNCDAHSMMQLDETGECIVRMARDALRSADLAPDDVDHVSAHGTSTVLNDKTESVAFRKLFGGRVDEVWVTALKSMTGHAIAGSGALETAALALSFRHGRLTPTINYDEPDPECDVRIVANAPIEHRPAAALKFSYGFGGHNACLVLTRA